MMKLIVSFHNFANALKNWWNILYRKEVPGVGYNVETGSISVRSLFIPNDLVCAIKHKNFCHTFAN
jgi:hypothetical protein